MMANWCGAIEKQRIERADEGEQFKRSGSIDTVQTRRAFLISKSYSSLGLPPTNP